MAAVSLLAPAKPDEIVGLRLQGTDGALPAGRVVTFGEVFASGEIPAGQGLVARMGGTEVPVQMDVKTRWDDGSVRHAVLSLAVPSDASSTDLMLARGAPPSGAAVALPGAGWDVTVTVDLRNPDGSVTRLSVSAAQALATAAPESWLSGPLATETRVTARLNDQLTATFDIRALADGTVRTDVTVSNDWAYTTPMTNLVYDVTVAENGRAVLQETALSHNHHANWHVPVWSGAAEPAVLVVHDPLHMMKTGAVPALDLGLDLNSSRIETQWAQIQSGVVDAGPMGSAFVTKYMPQTGERSDIGVLPTWSAQWLIGQGEAAYEVMLANADAAGSVPWHFRSEATGDWVTVDERPNLWIDSRGTNARFGADAMRTPYETKLSTGWTPDTAHAPSLTALPYLVTGDRHYLDELQAQANYAMLSVDPAYRGKSQGIVESQQIRAQAWTLRTLADAATLTPDADPAKGYFTSKLGNNLDFLNQMYVLGGARDFAGQLEGYSGDGGSRDPNMIQPWQDDYLTQALAYAAEQGFATAKTLVEWKLNFEAGRFVNEDLGFDPLHGPSGDFIHRAGTKTALGAYFTTWRDLHQANFGDPTKVYPALGLYASSSSSYAANARSALAATVSLTWNPDAIEAWGFLVGKLGMDGAARAATALDPKYTTMPRLPDGTILSSDQIRLASTAGLLVGEDRNQMLHGSAGGDTVQGGSAIDLLFGGDGDDLLNGADGDDVLIGGNGHDVLMGGVGCDVLRGKGGLDTLDGGDGDDLLFYQPGDALSGGAGNDTLALMDWRPTAIDLRDGRITGIETITLDNRAADTVTVSAAALGAGQIVIRGEVGDAVLGEGLTRGGDVTLDGQRYASFRGGSGRLLVESGLLFNGAVLGAQSNRAPLAQADWFETAAGTPVTMAVLANDTDPDGDSLSLAGIVRGPSGGGVAVDGEGRVTYTPNAGFSGPDSFVYELSDGMGGSSEGVVSITVTAAAAGPTVIDGTETSDWLEGGGGPDVLRGGGGSDTLSGGAGDDTLDGGAMGDKLYGGAGDDVYYVERSDRVIEYGGEGTDTVYASGNIALSAEVENLVLLTGAVQGAGNQSANTIIGNEAANLIRGYYGNDLLLGGAGDDSLDGQGNDDTLDGGLGDDLLTGGWQRDLFRYAALGDGRDTVTDFVVGEDAIDLRAFAGARVGIAASASGAAISVDAQVVMTLTGVDANRLRLGTDVLVG
ncbi:MAG: cadherin-like domain-containing protein [Alphaproteobacteria bacterium]|nr:cadherin-like domain-containing protein [Alphaproteobacteria bacterium]